MVVARRPTLAGVVARLAELAKLRVKVGVLASNGAQQHGDSDATIAEIAACQEFGTETIPERSFLRAGLHTRVAELRATQAKLAKAFIEGKLDGKRALGLLGAWAQSAVKAQIVQHDIPPPLAAATIAAKGSSKPLVDTGQLLNAITWAVDSGDEGVEP